MFTNHIDLIYMNKLYSALNNLLWLICRKTKSNKVKLATVVEGDQKAPFSIATTPGCREGRYSFLGIAPLYP